MGHGQALSARIPIRVPGVPSGDLDGYFTKTVRVNTFEDEKRLYEEQRKKYPEFTELPATAGSQAAFVKQDHNERCTEMDMSQGYVL